MTIPTLLTLRFGVAAVLIGGWLWSRGGLRLPRRSDAGAVVLMGLLYVAQAACFFGSVSFFGI